MELLYPNSYEALKLRELKSLLPPCWKIEIYDQARTGSIYGNIFIPGGGIISLRIADHPSRFSPKRFIKSIVQGKKRIVFSKKFGVKDGYANPDSGQNAPNCP